MTELFLHPPFDDPAILARILGPEAPALAARPATLAGHALREDAAGLRVALVPSRGARVAGHLAAPAAAARARLDFAMAALGAAPLPVRAVAEGAGVAAEAYCFDPDRAPEPDDLDNGSPVDRRARFAETLVEVMGHFGRRAAAEMPPLLPGIGVRALARVRGPATTAPVVLGSGLSAADVVPIAREFSYARFFGMEEHRLAHRRFDGAMSDRLDRAVFTSGDAVTVLPFDPRAGTVLLVEQFRAGPHARRDPGPWCLETVAGRCDRTEPPEATARREAREEAGLALGRLERIAAYYPSPGIVAEYLTSFVGEADLGAAGGNHGLPEEHEDIRALVVTLDAALAAVAAGEINTAPLMLSLLWLERNAARLRAAWS